MKNKEKERLGRPPLGEEKRRYRIAASFTLEERDRILDIAKWFGLTPSELLYRAALLQKISAPPPAVNLAAIRQINSINQQLKLIISLLQTGCRIDTRVVDKYFAILADLKSVIMEK